MTAKEHQVLDRLQSQIDRLRVDGKDLLWRADVLAEAHAELSKAFALTPSDIPNTSTKEK